MNYNYNTPEQAIISLENAFSNKDIANVVASKNFEAEAKIALQRTNVELNEETIDVTAKLLKLSLVEYILNNGFPDFSMVKRQFSELSEMDNDLYFIEEMLIYENGETYSNIVFLTFENEKWKVAMTEEK
jgi:predicted double-glycine peptidase